MRGLLLDLVVDLAFFGLVRLELLFCDFELLVQLRDILVQNRHLPVDLFLEVRKLVGVVGNLIG